jgi:hypothetical protein
MYPQCNNNKKKIKIFLNIHLIEKIEKKIGDEKTVYICFKSQTQCLSETFQNQDEVTCVKPQIKLGP